MLSHTDLWSWNRANVTVARTRRRHGAARAAVQLGRDGLRRVRPTAPPRCRASRRARRRARVRRGARLRAVRGRRRSRRRRRARAPGGGGGAARTGGRRRRGGRRDDDGSSEPHTPGTSVTVRAARLLAGVPFLLDAPPLGVDRYSSSLRGDVLNTRCRGATPPQVPPRRRPRPRVRVARRRRRALRVRDVAAQRRAGLACVHRRSPLKQRDAARPPGAVTPHGALSDLAPGFAVRMAMVNKPQTRPHANMPRNFHGGCSEWGFF